MTKYGHMFAFSENDSHYLLLKQIRCGSKVLEFGCANGNMTRIMSDVLNCEVSIVEYEQDAFNEAMHYAKDGICGDISNFEWVNKFTDKFDYIMFADVLEHLRNPEEVLINSKKLLAKNGKILISIPNIAHNDIIANLFKDDFNYKSLGLLDNTHVHFFTWKSFEKFCSKNNFTILKKDYTQFSFGTTEQGRQDIHIFLKKELESRQYGDAYQFIYTLGTKNREAYLESTNDKETIKKLDKIKNEIAANSPKIYFDFGKGFSEKETLTPAIERVGKHLSLSIQIPGGIKKLRIDPCELSCNIKIEKLVGIKNNNSASLNFKTNGDKKAKGKFRFLTTDPIIEITSDISKYEFITFVYELDVLNTPNCTNHCKNTVKKEDFLENLEKEINEKSQYIAQLQANIVAMTNSRSWRITKPIRAMGEWIRKIKIIKWPMKFLSSLKQVGVNETFKKVNQKIKNKLKINNANKEVNTNKRIQNLSEKEKSLLKIYPNAINQIISLERYKYIFERVSNPMSGEVKFSILVPLYNTNEQMLKEMMESVLIQSYDNFELCLANGSDTKHSYVEKICYQYAKKDQRVMYKKLEKNLGISGNTNACMSMATGEFIVLFDHDDFLHPLALEKVYNEIQNGADFIYSDNGIFTNKISQLVTPNYKMDYAPDTLKSINYICNLTCFKRVLFNVCGGGFNPEYDGAQDHDLILRLTDKAKKNSHIKELLYFWRSHPGSTAQNTNEKPYAGINGRKAVTNFLERKRINADVSSVNFCQTMYRIKYELKSQPLVSIIILNVDNKDNLKKCINSILTKTTYQNFEILICNVDDEKTVNIEKFCNNKIHIVTYNKPVNYSAMNNFAANKAKGKYLLLLDNDTEIIEPQWIEELLMYAQRDDVGAVGAKLLYPNNRVQHAGIILGLNGIADSAFKNKDKNDPVYCGLAGLVRNTSAVSGACMMTRKDVWNKINGFNEDYISSYSDIDFCMKARSAGYLIVFTPFSLLYHNEINKKDTGNKNDAHLFKSLWKKELDAGDPYYNPNFSLKKEKDFTV